MKWIFDVSLHLFNVYSNAFYLSGVGIHIQGDKDLPLTMMQTNKEASMTFVIRTKGMHNRITLGDKADGQQCVNRALI